MPMFGGESISSDEAMRRGLCPECGAPLINAQTARAHADDHWGGRGFLSAEGQRRRDFLFQFASIHTPAETKSAPAPASELAATEERHWWALQNRLGNIWSQIAIAAIGAGLIEIGDGAYGLGALYLLCGCALMFVVNAKMKSTTAIPNAKPASDWRRYLRYMSVTLTWALFSLYIYGHFTNKPDPRLIPLNTLGFFDGMHMDTNQVFRMVCFPYDPDSCNIAAQYRNVFVDYWTPSPDPTSFEIENPAPFHGFQIITQSEKHPTGSLELRQKLSQEGPGGFYVSPQMVKNPNEFWIVIGARP